MQNSSWAKKKERKKERKTKETQIVRGDEARGRSHRSSMVGTARFAAFKEKLSVESRMVTLGILRSGYDDDRSMILKHTGPERTVSQLGGKSTDNLHGSLPSLAQQIPHYASVL